MKIQDFKLLMTRLNELVKDKKLTFYSYGNGYMLHSEGIKQAEAINIVINSSGFSLTTSDLYDLKPNKFGGKSYSDSKQTSCNYYDITIKQLKVINAFFESIYHIENEY